MSEKPWPRMVRKASRGVRPNSTTPPDGVSTSAARPTPYANPLAPCEAPSYANVPPVTLTVGVALLIVIVAVFEAFV